jgi:hypothetical protein
MQTEQDKLSIKMHYEVTLYLRSQSGKNLAGPEHIWQIT